MIYLYPTKLQDEIKKSLYIPRRINKNEHLKIFHKYYIPEYGICKIISVDSIYDIEYYTIRCDNRYSFISYPVSNTEVYELLHNKDKIEKLNIINSKSKYTGAEIRYWFVMNEDDKLIKDFWKYLIYFGKDSLIDNKLYSIQYNKNKHTSKIKAQ